MLSKFLSQNFLINRKLITHLVSMAGFLKNDVVVDIGAGTGAISYELAKFCKHVIAVEIDQNLAKKIKGEDIDVICSDILKFSLPSGNYKVFANIPFNITAEIVHKLLDSHNPPLECYLIMQKEAAEKFSGIKKETQFSILYKPFFNFEIIWEFKRSDFRPMAGVDIVLLKITKRLEPMVLNKSLYTTFIKMGFNLRGKKIFTYTQWKRLAKDNGFSIHSSPTDLNFNQWLNIYNFHKNAYRK